MSWLFSQALVEEYSAASCSDGEPSAQLSVRPTPHKFWRNDKTIECSNLSQFGLTSRVLTDAHGEELLTSYRAVSRARTSAERAKAQASMAREAASGPIWLGSFAKYDRDSSSWKTAQCSLLGDSEEFSETWPRWGSMRNGESFLRQIPVLPICESASGLWQTPVADDAIERKAGKWNSRGEPKLSAEVKLWPTPVASDTGARSRPYAQGGTPLSYAVQRWPTPTAITNSGGTAMCKWGGSGSREKLRSMVSPEELNGLLNPTWVEWLMGWPIGWTELKPLAMGRFREWQEQHSLFSHAAIADPAA